MRSLARSIEIGGGHSGANRNRDLSGGFDSPIRLLMEGNLVLDVWHVAAVARGSSNGERMVMSNSVRLLFMGCTALTVVVLGLGIASSPASAKGRNTVEVEGILVSIDSKALSLQIQTRRKGIVTVTTDATTKFEKNDKLATLGDFVTGDKVEAKVSTSTGIAFKVEAEDEGEDD